MIIETARKLDAWSRERLEDSGALPGLDDAAAAHAVQSISAVVWRNAVGQGLRLGQDWGWILDAYDAAAIRGIVEASIEAQAATAANRRRRGF
jgi:hypothetical protein